MAYKRLCKPPSGKKCNYCDALCLVDEVPDLLLPVGGGPGRGLDHGGGLHVGQLLQAPLTRHNPAHLKVKQSKMAEPDKVGTGTVRYRVIRYGTYLLRYRYYFTVP